MSKDKRGALAQEVKRLADKGHLLLVSELFKHLKEIGREADIPELPDEVKKMDARKEYQKWYTLSLPAIGQLVPDRLQEFKDYYLPNKRKDISYDNYTINDYLMGIVVRRYNEPIFDIFSAFHSRFQIQIQILDSAKDRLESKFRSIEGVLQAELFENELAAADELLKKGHLRASGALAGVTLEMHLSKVVQDHKIAFKKKNLVRDYNDSLKDQEIIDVPMWRFIQRLGDIRNLCTHKKERDPKNDELEDLLSGVRKVIAEVF
jgi:hypothetical protein